MATAAFNYSQAERTNAILNKHRVRFVFFGKSGAILLGFSDTTQDVDIFPSKERQNCKRLIAALSELKTRKRRRLQKERISFSFETVPSISTSFLRRMELNRLMTFGAIESWSKGFRLQTSTISSRANGRPGGRETKSRFRGSCRSEIGSPKTKCTDAGGLDPPASSWTGFCLPYRYVRIAAFELAGVAPDQRPAFHQ